MQSIQDFLIVWDLKQIYDEIILLSITDYSVMKSTGQVLNEVWAQGLFN